MYHVAASLNRVNAAAVPFLAPAIVAWITFGVGVMIYYFLIVARRPRPGRGLSEPDRNPPPPLAPARPWVARSPSRSDLPAYDMEEFPEDRWELLAAPAATASERRRPATSSPA